MSYIWISGDSFCWQRENSETDWPLILANQLGLELEGEGFPGQHWWPVMKTLLDYAQTEKFAQTEYFIICHTDCDRVITPPHIKIVREEQFTPKEREHISEIYFKYIYSREMMQWMSEMYFKDLNQILADKKPIYLNVFGELGEGFETDKHLFNSILNGMKTSPDQNLRDFCTHDYDAYGPDTHPNHFTSDQNQKFADILFNNIQNYTPNSFVQDLDLLHK